MAPASAVVALRTVTLPLAFAFGYFVNLASVSYVGRPEVAVDAPPVPVIVVTAVLVLVRVLFLTSSVHSSDLLVYVIRVGVEAFAGCPILTHAVKFLVSLQV